MFVCLGLFGLVPTVHFLLQVHILDNTLFFHISYSNRLKSRVWVLNLFFSLAGLWAWKRLQFTGCYSNQYDNYDISPFGCVVEVPLTRFTFINWYAYRVLIMGGLYILGAVLYGCRWISSDLKQILLRNRDLLGLSVPPSHGEVSFSSNLVQDSWEVPAWKIRHLVPVSSGKHMINSTEIKLLSINRAQT